MAAGPATAGPSPPHEEPSIDRLLTLLGSLPIGIERLVRTAVGPSPRRLPVIPGLLVLLTALTIIPVGQALVEIIVRPVTVAELVDRQVGLSTRLVAVDGFALLVPFDAEAPPEASDSHLVYHWYAVRDSLQELRLILVRSQVIPEALRSRSVVARVVADEGAVDRTVAGLAARGGPDQVDGLARVLLIEEEPGQQSIKELGSLTELDDARVGELVRVKLEFGDELLSGWREFDDRLFSRFSDEDLLDALFRNSPSATELAETQAEV